MNGKFKCVICGVDVGLQLHHLKPRRWGGTDKDGRFWICKPHHDELDSYLATLGKEWTLKWVNEKTLKTNG